MTNLQTSKENALNSYKEAKTAWAETITSENIKGDFEKWKILCKAKSECMKLGIIL